MEYEKAQGYLQTLDKATTVYNKDNIVSQTGESKRFYDVNGNLQEARDANGEHSIFYLNDSREGVKARREKDSVTGYLNVGGNVIADIKLNQVTNEQTLEVYSGFTPQGSAQKSENPYKEGTMGHALSGAIQWQNYSLIAGADITDFLSAKEYYENAGKDATGAPTNLASDNLGSYTVKGGDTLQSIALEVYGDASLWYLIADANGITDGSIQAGSVPGPVSPDDITKAKTNRTNGLQPGTQITIPPAANGQHHTNATHKVYNPQAMLGDTSATTPTPPPPPPPPQKKHSWWKKALVGITVAITAAFLGPMAGPFLAQTLGFTSTLAPAILGGFVGGFAGNIAGQAMSVALNMQHNLNLKSAFVTGIATAATAGLAQLKPVAQAMNMLGEFSTDYFNVESAAKAFVNDSISQISNMAFHVQKHFDWIQAGTSAGTGGMLGSKNVQDFNKKITPNTVKDIDKKGVINKTANSFISGTAQVLASGGHYNAWDTLSQAFANSAGGELGDDLQKEIRQSPNQYAPIPSGGAYAEYRPNVLDEEEGIRLTPKDIDKVLEGLDRINNLQLDLVDDGSDPNKVHVFVVFDGTWNDRDVMQDLTNPALLWDLFESQQGRGTAIYKKGVGTDPETKHLGGGLGFGAENRVNDAYEQLVDIINQTKKINSDAEIILSISGFSRGSTEARYFANMVADKGIPDLSSKINGYYTKSLETPRIADLVIFDTVVAMSPLSNQSRGMKLSIPNEVENVLHITADDEKRRLFPLTSAIDPSNPNDRRITEIGLPGVHSDIGGSYHNPYSRIPLNMAYDYMKKIGIPMKPIGGYKAPSAFDASLRLHDSRYTYDKVLDKIDDTFHIPHYRRIYSAK